MRGWGAGAMKIGIVGAGEGQWARGVVDVGAVGRRDGDVGASVRRKEPPEAGAGNKTTSGAVNRDPGGR